MSMSTTTTLDERVRLAVRSSVRRILAAASRLSCGLIPSPSIQHPPSGSVEETVTMENALPLVAPHEPLAMDITPSSNTGQEDVVMENPSIPEAPELERPTISNVPSPEGNPEPEAVQVVLPQPPPPPPPPPPPFNRGPPPPPFNPGPPPPPVVRHIICIVCQEAEETEDARFPYKCPKCCSSEICMECLKEWFVDACKNESKMPPKCYCSAIPVSAVTKVLSSEQIKLYKAKFEEYSTPDRLYCPVPTCSTFIPPRLFRRPKAAEEIMNFQLPVIAHLVGQNETPQDPSFVMNMSLQSPATTKPLVSCPTCEVSICTKCRALEHVGECSSDLDPAFEELLKKWRIKRCPKCRTGVRKVYGCSHVECRCGAHFCWACLKPYNKCDQSCPQESDDDESSLEDDDLDGQAGFYEGDEHDFGDEPDHGIAQPWSCRHDFSAIEPPSSSSSSARDAAGEEGDGAKEETEIQCSNCFRAVVISGDEEKMKVPEATDEDADKGETNNTTLNLELNLPIWRCYGEHETCNVCPEEALLARENDASRLHSCDCGLRVCIECNVHDVEAQWPQVVKKRRDDREKEASRAWECDGCAAIVCGSCKVFMEEDNEPRYMP